MDMVNENAGINHTQEEYIMNDETRLRGFGDLAENEDGMGTIEVILIIVVLIGLVIIFQKQLKGLVEKVFKKINSDADSIIS
jgi:Flp pilus assembly pilin Flp